MKNVTAIGCAALSLLLIAGCGQQEQTISLRFKYEPGMRLVYEQTTKSTYETTTADSLIEEGTKSYDVSIIATIANYVDDSAVTMIDSSTWRWTEPSKEDSAMVDTIEHFRTTEAIILPNGRHASVEVPGAQDASVAWLRNYYEQGMPVFPAGELHIGFSWTQTTRVLLPDETMDATTTYKIKSLAREGGYDCAVIEYDGNLIIPVQPRTKDSCQVSGVDDIEIDGVTYFAYKDGVIMSERQNWVATGHRVSVDKKGDTSKYVVKTVSDVDFHLVQLTRP